MRQSANQSINMSESSLAKPKTLRNRSSSNDRKKKVPISEMNKRMANVPQSAQIPRTTVSLSTKNTRQKVQLPGQNINKPPLLPPSSNQKNKIESRQNSKQQPIGQGVSSNSIKLAQEKIAAFNKNKQMTSSMWGT
jgi:hypothetical protein